MADRCRISFFVNTTELTEDFEEFASVWPYEPSSGLVWTRHTAPSCDVEIAPGGIFGINSLYITSEGTDTYATVSGFPSHNGGTLTYYSQDASGGDPLDFHLEFNDGATTTDILTYEVVDMGLDPPALRTATFGASATGGEFTFKLAQDPYLGTAAVLMYLDNMTWTLNT